MNPKELPTGQSSFKSKVPALTGIRYIAAVMILVQHLFSHTGYSWLDRLIGQLNMGVTIFFLLSGFLISFRYFDDYTESPVWKRSYIINRIARIYPMYALVTCFSFLFLFRSDPDHKEVLKSFFLNISFLRGFSAKYVYSGVAQGWTLTVEELFYLLAPFIFFWSRKIPLVLQSLFFLGCGLLIICSTGLMPIKTMWICTFFGRSFEFMCGIYLFFIIRNNSFRPRFKVTLPAVVSIGALLYCMDLLSYPPYRVGIQNPIGLAINNYVMPISIGLLFWGLINERSVFQRVLSTKLFDVLGKSSYTLYLIHFGTFTYFVRQFAGNILLVVLIIQLSAIVAWGFIEEPLNRWIRKLGGNAKVASLSVAPKTT